MMYMVLARLFCGSGACYTDDVSVHDTRVYTRMTYRWNGRPQVSLQYRLNRMPFSLISIRMPVDINTRIMECVSPPTCRISHLGLPFYVLSRSVLSGDWLLTQGVD